MATGNAGTPKEKMVIGTLLGGIGAYFVLVGLSMLPLPGGPQNLHSPLWVVVCIGLVFFIAGAAVFLQGIAGANEHGELPADASPWLRATQYWMVGALCACLAAIGSWIAFGPGEREFTGSGGIFDGNLGVSIGRIMFGFGAITMWIITLLFVVSGARKLSRGNKSGPK